jgi:multiple sugar transport system permease protein
MGPGSSWRRASLFFALYVIIPIFAELLAVASTTGTGSATKTWLGLDNYVELFDDEAFYTSLEQHQMAGALSAGGPGGAVHRAVPQPDRAGIRIYKSLFFFPFVISQVVVGLIFSWFYLPRFGLLTS